jgi:cysteine sulfinate desulfinase/cysteine desulfurase-like protein
MNINAERAAGAIRLSVGMDTTDRDTALGAELLIIAWSQYRKN